MHLCKPSEPISEDLRNHGRSFTPPDGNFQRNIAMAIPRLTCYLRADLTLHATQEGQHQSRDSATNRIIPFASVTGMTAYAESKPVPFSGWELDNHHQAVISSMRIEVKSWRWP